MKIALIGYGKMGKIIEEIAIARGHEIALKIDIHNLDMFTAANLQNCDVAIEFTNPHSAVANLQKCFDAGINVVCGTTGWDKDYLALENLATEKGVGFLHTTNFSIGVNLFFALNRHLASIMHKYDAYEPSLLEIHHTEKKDAPSGTAITLAEGILSVYDHKKKWVNSATNNPEELSILSERIDPAPGTHTINYHSDIDDITITHTAHNRKGFATGAVLAAEFLYQKKGIFTMKDVLAL